VTKKKRFKRLTPGLGQDQGNKALPLANEVAVACHLEQGYTGQGGPGVTVIKLSFIWG
jgi:hypothetical protein